MSQMCKKPQAWRDSLKCQEITRLLWLHPLQLPVYPENIYLTTRDASQLSAFIVSYILRRVCVDARVSVRACAPGSPGHLVPVTEIAERLVCHVKAEMTAERRVFKSVRLCACVYQAIRAFSNPLMDRLTPPLTWNSTYLCSVCVRELCWQTVAH